MGNFDERDERAAQPVIIEDKRHGRAGDAAEDEPEIADTAVALAAEAEQPAGEPEPLTTPVPAALEPEQGALAPAEPGAAALLEPGTAEAGEAEFGDELGEEQYTAAQQAEMAYLMQLFQLGLPAYMRSQLGILLNFAMINLGRMPNPATGLVTADLEQAKLAIDTFEFLLVKVQTQLDQRERLELTQLLSDMKYTFMQAIGGPGVPGAGAAPGAG